jgi:hypothetical protein
MEVDPKPLLPILSHYYNDLDILDDMKYPYDLGNLHFRQLEKAKHLSSASFPVILPTAPSWHKLPRLGAAMEKRYPPVSSWLAPTINGRFIAGN